MLTSSKSLDIYKTNNPRFETKTEYKIENKTVSNYNLSSYYNYYSTVPGTIPESGMGTYIQTKNENINTGKYYSDQDTNSTYPYETWETSFKKRNDKIIYDEENNYKTYGASPNNYYFYVSYEDVSPYIITRNDIMSNHNYYMQDFKNLTVVDYSTNYDSINNVTSYDIHYHGNDNYVLGGLLHKYCQPTICPYNYQYAGYKDISIGYVDVKYRLARNNEAVSKCNKNIPVLFTAYKCEAYKKK